MEREGTIITMWMNDLTNDETKQTKQTQKHCNKTKKRWGARSFIE
jgi:hypothetical protein